MQYDCPSNLNNCEKLVPPKKNHNRAMKKKKKKDGDYIIDAKILSVLWKILSMRLFLTLR